ncbi:MAG: hypothetical protein N3A61_06255, partial [Ignavibacteria bacterium]|nr:hypothetical protein [Ignavibacteria bacterium]
TKDELLSSSSFSRNYEISSSIINTKFSYFPIKRIEVSFKVEVGRSYDYFPAIASQVDFNSLQLGFVFFVSDLSRLNLEFERSELLGNTSTNVLPFELLKGNNIGKNYYLRINFDYRISSNLQASLNYDGRQQGNSKFIHNGRAEMRAYF